MGKLAVAATGRLTMQARRSRSRTTSTADPVEWALIFACLALPTLFLGGLHPLGKLLYLALVAALALYQTLARPRPDEAKTGIDAIGFVAVAVVAAQLVPLPAGLLETLGGGYRELLPLWNGDSAFGRWTTISLVPHATKLGLGTLLAHASFFRSVAKALRKEADLDRAMLLVATLGLLAASLALAQYFLGDGRYLWVYDYPTRDAQDTAKIPFTNGNHLAHYLALCVGAWIWLLAAAARGDRLPTFVAPSVRSRSSFNEAARPEMLVLAGGACLVGASAALLTFSRGGAAVFVGAAVIATAWYAGRGLLPLRCAFGTGVVVAATIGVAALVGGERLARELDVEQFASWERLDPGSLRTRLWLADLEAWKRFPLFGSGVGSHREIYPTFYAHWYPKEYRFAESGFVHLLTETGAAGTLLAIVAIGVVGGSLLAARPKKSSRKAFRSRSTSKGFASPAPSPNGRVWGALAASFFVSVVHNVFDFPWFLPGCMALTTFLAATICRAASLRRAAEMAGTGGEKCVPGKPGSASLLNARAAVTVGAVVTLVWLGVSAHLPEVRGASAWDDYLRVAVRFEGRGMFDGSADAATNEDVSRMIDALQRRLHATPEDHRASVRLAGLCLRRFEQEQLASDNAFGLSDLRETLARGGFRSEEARREWIARVLGPRQQLLTAAAAHARRALRRSPLDGEAYVYLAAAGPFATAETTDADLLYEQALAVRPYDGTTLLHAAEHAARTGDGEASVDRFRRAYAIVPPVRERIVATLAPMTPPAFLLDEIGLGESVEGSRRLAERYLAQGRPAEATIAAERWRRLLSGDEVDGDGNFVSANPLRSWIALADVWEKLERYDRLADALAQAAKLAPEEYVVRRRYAFALVAVGRYDLAEGELSKCLRIRPGDPHVLRQRAICRERQAAARRSLPGPSQALR